eukprot:1528472-Amphidinium_carterae.1
MELNYFAMTWEERRTHAINEYEAETFTARGLMFMLEMYGIDTQRARASAQDMGAWVLDTLWAEVRARINRVDSVATKKNPVAEFSLK